MCLAEHLEVVSFNGLKVAESCHPYEVPFFHVGLFNTIGGSLPPCIWALRNLTVLHLAGNGLTGAIKLNGESISKLVDLSLSHNQFSGSIPVGILNITKLDLSYNHFTGKYMKQDSHSVQSEIKLEINRLSGHLPASELDRVQNGGLQILRGNMFSCGSIPTKDDFAEDYICGSQDLNFSLYVLLAIAGICLIVIIAVLLAGLSTRFYTSRGILAHLFAKTVQLRQYGSYFMNMNRIKMSPRLISPELLKISFLSDSFGKTELLFCKLLLIVLIMSMPLYIVKMTNDSVTTHSNTYTWHWTFAYMRGQLPSGLILLLWVATCFCFAAVHPKLDPVSVEKCERNGDAADKKEPKRSFAPNTKDYIPLCAALFFNASVMITVNSLYIYSTQQDFSSSFHLFVQVLLAIFRMIFAQVALPILASTIDDAVLNTLFRFILLTFNNLFIPCVVTAFTSPSCFQVIHCLAHKYILCDATILLYICVADVLLCDLALASACVVTYIFYLHACV
jgi:hypothetical protein